MAVDRVREVPADSLAATQDTTVPQLLMEHTTVSLWEVALWRCLCWPFRNPLETVALAPGVAAAVYFRSAGAGLFGATMGALLVLAGQVAWVARRGTAGSLWAILSGMSRQRHIVAAWAGVCYRRKLTARTQHGVTLVPSLRDFRIGPAELTARVSTVPLAEDSSVLAKHTQGLAAGLSCDRVLLDLDTNRTGTVTFQWGVHLRRQIHTSDVPASGTWRMVNIGIDERGEPLGIPSNKSILCVAETGAGKSNAAWALLAGYIRDVGADCLRVRVLDPKEIEFRTLKERLDSAAPGICHQYETADDPKALAAFWENVDSAMAARVAAVRKAGVREWVPTPEQPLDLTIVDEMIPIAAGLRKDGPEHTAGKIAFKGRAYAFVIMGLSQAGQIDVLGRIRDLFPTRIAFKTGSQTMTDVVLGDGATARGARCHELSEDLDKGVGFVSFGGRPKAFRAAVVPDADMAYVARGELPPAPREVEWNRENRTTRVYRHWGYRILDDLIEAKRTLLYVGITNDLERRAEQHAQDKPWMRGLPDAEGTRWADVEIETRESESFPLRSLAETQELLIIAREWPLYNDVGNRENPLRRQWRQRVQLRKVI